MRHKECLFILQITVFDLGKVCKKKRLAMAGCQDVILEWK